MNTELMRLQQPKRGHEGHQGSHRLGLPQPVCRVTLRKEGILDIPEVKNFPWARTNKGKTPDRERTRDMP